MTTYQSFVLTSMLRSYLMGEYDEKTNDQIRASGEEIALADWLVYVIEIAYHIGYAKSILADNISEATYKKMKHVVADNLFKRLQGGQV